MNTKLSASKIGLLIVLAMATASASLAAQDKPAFWHIKTLYAFTGNADGAQPFGGVVLDPAGNVYGTTAFGGNGGGVVFKVDPRGHESLLHTFTGYPGDGANPTEGVTRDSTGRLYGLTVNLLTLYELQPSATVCAAVLCPWNESFLYNSEIGQVGSLPTGIPLPDGLGNFYATSNTGGSGTNCEVGCGFVFKVDPQGHETVIYNFQGGSDGAWPTGPMLLAPDGSLYGTTVTGGGAGGCPNGGCGTVYKIDAYGNESVLYSFTGGNDGESPDTGVIADEKGNLYGTTPVGGPYMGNGCSGES
ncbi:MAG: choice-of-anchor tandem repeat GloVer-containing protein, partial [Candidatus Korobacteraceae bacterium]